MTAFTNPILPGYYPDPSILRVGDTFYLVNSTFEHFPGLPIHRSTDLVNWELVCHAVDRPEQLNYTAIRASGGLYAPTIREHNGTFYIACTHVDGQGEHSGNFYITASHPEGPWSDPIWVDFPGIDPSFYFEGDRAWWMGCAPAEPVEFEGHNATWLQEIDVATGQLLGERVQLWDGALRGAVWCEGPHIFRKDGWYYLLTAEGGTEFNHAITVARSRALEGPYEGNRCNPVLTHRHLGRSTPIQYVGHSDIFDDPAGNWWAVALATRPVNGKHVLGRETFLIPVSWEDDWPVFAPGTGMVPTAGDTDLVSSTTVENPGHVPGGDLLEHARNVLAAGDLSTSRVLALRGSFANFAAPTEPESTSHILLTATDHRLSDQGTPAFMAVRTPAPVSTFTATLQAEPWAGTGGIVGNQEVLEYGLAILQNDRNHLRASVKASADGTATAQIIERKNGLDQELASLELTAFDGAVEATIQVTPTDVALTVATSAGSITANTNVDAIATETAGGFVGAVAGPFVQGASGARAVVSQWAVTTD